MLSQQSHPPRAAVPNQSTIARPDSAINQTLTRIEAIAKALQSLDIDFRDRIDAAAQVLRAPTPPRPCEEGRPVAASNGPLADRLDDIETVCHHLADRVAALRELVG